MFDISSFILDIYWTGLIKSLAVTQEINFRRVAAMFFRYTDQPRSAIILGSIGATCLNFGKTVSTIALPFQD